VAVIGSLLATGYRHRLSDLVSPYHLPQTIVHAVLSSLGSALEVAQRVGGPAGAALAHAARDAFTQGMHLGFLAAAGVVAAGCVLAIAWLPARPLAPPDEASLPEERP
jgi:DHA2 family multidrug resistance protein-like MFS transporter